MTYYFFPIYLQLAARNYTYRLPDIKENPKQLIKLAGKFLNQIRLPLAGCTVANAFLAALITYYEYEAMFTINEKLLRSYSDSDNIIDDTQNKDSLKK